MATEIMELQKKTDGLILRSHAITILSDEDFAQAVEFRKAIRAGIQEVNDTFQPIRKKQYAAWVETCAQEKRHIKPLEEALAIVDKKVVDYRNQREQAAKLEQLQRQEEAKKIEENIRINTAIELEKQGRGAEATQVINAPLVTPAVPIQNVPKAEGISFRKEYRARVINFRALIESVANKTTPEIALEANTTFLNKQAGSLKENLNIPGVEVYSIDITVQRNFRA